LQLSPDKDYKVKQFWVKVIPKRIQGAHRWSTQPSLICHRVKLWWKKNIQN